MSEVADNPSMYVAIKRSIFFASVSSGVSPRLPLILLQVAQCIWLTEHWIPVKSTRITVPGGLKGLRTVSGFLQGTYLHLIRDNHTTPPDRSRLSVAGHRGGGTVTLHTLR